jgi:hypothetical protein
LGDLVELLAAALGAALDLVTPFSLAATTILEVALGLTAAIDIAAGALSAEASDLLVPLGFEVSFWVGATIEAVLTLVATPFLEAFISCFLKTTKPKGGNVICRE